jgi:hypothetical protein
MPSSHRAQPPLEFLPPAFDPWVMRGVKALLPLWMRWRSNVSTIHCNGVETLAKLFQDFQAGQVRFLIAFRHPSPEDAYCLAHLIWREVPQTAKGMGIQLQTAPHAHFIYDRGIPLWAGKGVGWLYQKLGGTPIQRGKVDRQGLKSAVTSSARANFPWRRLPKEPTTAIRKSSVRWNRALPSLDFGAGKTCKRPIARKRW